jgi:hypothetical protein
MVKMIQIERLGQRIDGMLYRISFDEQWALLDEVGFFFPHGMSTVEPRF